MQANIKYIRTFKYVRNKHRKYKQAQNFIKIMSASVAPPRHRHWRWRWLGISCLAQSGGGCGRGRTSVVAGSIPINQSLQQSKLIGGNLIKY